MKTLIFALILSLQVFADDTMNEVGLSDAEISRKLITVAKEIDNQQILANQSDLQKCRDDFQRAYKPAGTDQATQDANNAALSALNTCIGQKIGNAENATRIADSLNLDTYKLVESKTVKNVTEYLSKNLYRQLTGVDLDQDRQARIRAQAFKNKKQLDQKMFFDLYKNQVAKNALYEVSRFCFVDLRMSSPASANKTFAEHWGNLADFENDIPTGIAVKDDGLPAFEADQTQSPSGSTPAPAQDTQSAYKLMAENILGTGGAVPKEKALNNFFFFCGRKIQELCSKYEEKCSSRDGKTTCTETSGARACLAKTRLTAYRNALAGAGKIMEEYQKDIGNDVFVQLNPNQVVKRYGARGDKSVNELTNNSSAAFIEATNSLSTQEAQKCIDANGAENDCEAFTINSESENRILTNTEIVYAAKKAAELKRVAELVRKNDQSLQEYLDKNYPDLKDKPKDQLENLIGNRWDAKKQSMIEEITNRIGKRQTTEAERAEQAQAGQPTKAQTTAKENAQNSLNERTRLGQVVLFNNIISSSLNLEDKSGKSVGRNTEALSNELAFAQEKGVQGQYFQNLQSLATESGGNGSGGNQAPRDSVESIGFLEQFIGIPQDQNGNGRGTAGTGSRR